jgi:hypothetical protein
VKKVDTTPDAFLASLPDDVGSMMTELDSIITSCLQERARVLWEGRFWGGTDQHIIGYGDIVQPRPRGEPVEWFLVGLARQQRSFSIYVNAVLDGAYLLERYAGRLGTVKTGAASINFGGLDDVDVDELKALLSHAHDVSPEDGAAPAV